MTVSAAPSPFYYRCPLLVPRFLPWIYIGCMWPTCGAVVPLPEGTLALSAETDDLGQESKTLKDEQTWSDLGIQGGNFSH